jgi:hypothetical protein
VIVKPRQGEFWRYRVDVEFQGTFTLAGHRYVAEALPHGHRVATAVVSRSCDEFAMSAGLARVAGRLVTPRAVTADCGVTSGAGDIAFDQPDLVDVRERQVGGGGQDLDSAGGDPAVTGLEVASQDSASRQRRAGAGCVLRWHELSTDRVQVLGMAALGV